MERLGTIWSGMDMQRRGLAVLAVVAFLAIVIGFGQAVSRPSMSLLYGGLEDAEAARVLQALDQRGTPYEVRAQSIFVPAPQRDTLRMELAGEGIPSASGTGYELLDTLSGFGTTSQMFDAAYWRAKEGELARTIVASPMIRDARVHIASAGTQPFRRSSRSTASVSITGYGTISRETAKALQFLVAAAVTDLAPEHVSVIDSRTGRVLAPSDGLDAGAAAEDREKALKLRVLDLLEAHAGPGNARVEISIERDLRQQTLTERQIDPESRTVISQDSEELSSQSSNGGAPSVTVASNLPSGDAAAEGEGSSEQRSETRERSNFDVSETRRETVTSPGAVKRLTVAVLINSGPEGADASARSEEDLADLRALVAAAVGLDEGRGDVLTLKELDFSGAFEQGVAAGPGRSWLSTLDPWQLIQLGVFALVTLVIGLFVVRPLLLAQQSGPALDDGPGPLTLVGTANEDVPDDLALQDALSNDALLASSDMGAPALSVASVDEGDALVSGGADPVERLKTMIESRQPDTLEVLRSWMEPPASDPEKA